jgi:hypothetical protein
MIKCWWIAVGLLLLSPLAFSQSDTAATSVSAGDAKKVLQEKLGTQFKLTKVSNDRSDIVTPGSVLILQKDGLQMCDVNAKVPFPSTYKDGKISTGFGEELGWGMVAGDTSQIARRKFVAGEKFWVTAFVVHDDGVIFQFYSDPYQDIRYYANIKIAFPKHNMPPPDAVLKAIADVITVQPDENAAASAPQPAPPPQQQAIAPIPPPPPPADAPPPQPKTISAGETKDQVVAIMGQPQKVVSLGKKEIDYYPDMKVIFVQGKVSDVE